MLLGDDKRPLPLDYDDGFYRKSHTDTLPPRYSTVSTSTKFKSPIGVEKRPSKPSLKTNPSSAEVVHSTVHSLIKASLGNVLLFQEVQKEKVEPEEDSDDFAVAILESSRASNEERYSLLMDFAPPILIRGMQKRNVENVKRAVDYLEEAHRIVDPFKDNAQEHYQEIVQLAYAHHGLYELQSRKSSRHIIRGTELLTEIIPFLPDHEKALALVHLGDFHRILHLLSPDRKTDSTHLTLSLRALHDSQKYPFSHPLFKNNSMALLGAVYGEAFVQTQKMSHLDQSLHYLKITAQIPGHEHDGPLMKKIGNALYYKHKKTDSLAHLDECIEYYQRSLSMTENAGSKDDGKTFYTTGLALVRRFSYTRLLDDLEKGVEYLDRAFKLAPQKTEREYEKRLSQARTKLGNEQAKILARTTPVAFNSAPSLHSGSVSGSSSRSVAFSDGYQSSRASSSKSHSSRTPKMTPTSSLHNSLPSLPSHAPTPIPNSNQTSSQNSLNSHHSNSRTPSINFVSRNTHDNHHHHPDRNVRGYSLGLDDDDDATENPFELPGYSVIDISPFSSRSSVTTPRPPENAQSLSRRPSRPLPVPPGRQEPVPENVSRNQEIQHRRNG